MTLLYGVDGHLGPRHIAYYEARAAGGIGFQVTEEHAVHPDMKGGFINAVSAFQTDAVPPFTEAANAVHRHGSALFVQLFASGIQDTGSLTLDWHPISGRLTPAPPRPARAAAPDGAERDRRARCRFRVLRP